MQLLFFFPILMKICPSGNLAHKYQEEEKSIQYTNHKCQWQGIVHDSTQGHNLKQQNNIKKGKI